jgi:hypothetical protein
MCGSGDSKLPIWGWNTPRFSVNVASKGFSFFVTPLESVFTEDCVTVDSKEVALPRFFGILVRC